MSAYLDALKDLVDAEAIRAAHLRVVVDPLYGAGRGYLSGLLRDMGVEVCEINDAADPTFDGLHPEPIPPWVDRGLAKVSELGYDAVFINDGDADRIGAGDEHGNFVNPHRIITLLVQHMVEDRHESGRVVSTITASALLDRMCRRLGLELVSTPVGFKWIYGEMEKGGVMIGGEESGGIGLPGHVKERDGLLMILLLCELMAQTGKTLGQLVAELDERVGATSYARRDLRLQNEDIEVLRTMLPGINPHRVAGRVPERVSHMDGLRLEFDDESWLLLRPSGTESLVRVYAEAPTVELRDRLLDAGVDIARGELS